MIGIWLFEHVSKLVRESRTRVTLLLALRSPFSGPQFKGLVFEANDIPKELCDSTNVQNLQEQHYLNQVQGLERYQLLALPFETRVNNTTSTMMLGLG